MSEAVRTDYRGDGKLIGEAIAEEAIVRCTDPVWGQMITKVIFRQLGRDEVTLERYMVGLETLAGISREEYLGSSTYGQDAFEQGLFDALDACGALDDRTQGPY